MIFLIGKSQDGMAHCPKCGFANPLPSRPGDPEDDRPRKKPRRDDDDDDERPRGKKARSRDDDEDEDERPRKKKRKRYADDDDDDDLPRRKRRASKGGGGAMVAVFIVGGLLLLFGVGAGIFFLVGKGSPFAKKAPVPPGWEQYSYPSAGFKAYMPKKPTDMTVAVNGMGFGGPRFGAGGRGRMGVGDEIHDAESLTVVSSGLPNDPVRTEVYVIRFRNQVPASIRDKIRNSPEMPVGGGETRTTRWLGYEAVEVTSKMGTARGVCADRIVIIAVVAGPNGSRATKAEEDGFFDNVELTK
jgi:hypothetical protein